MMIFLKYGFEMNLEMRFGLMNDYDVENVEIWIENVKI